MSSTRAIPDEVRIVHHASARLGAWVVRSECLADGDGRIRWLEHPNGRDVDLVALPLLQLDAEVRIYPLDLTLAAANMIPQVAMPVAIIGYPYGIATGIGWPIWKTGHIASDPDIDFDNRPAFLIDATTRGGMSGSPVVLRLTGGYPTREAWVISSGVATKLLGVYSGRIHGDAEIGRVWRPSLIDEILRQAA